MGFIRNILALIGFLAIICGGYLWLTFEGDYRAFQDLDPGAKDVYLKLWTGLKRSGNSAEATVWRFPLAEDVSWQDAEESMRSVANELNIKNVGELPLSEQVELMVGEKQRFLKIYQFCNPITAMQMVNHNTAYSAYLPCRIALVEEDDKSYSLLALDMDMMISGGKTLPPELLKEAQRVRSVILEIMERAAEGDF